MTQTAHASNWLGDSVVAVPPLAWNEDLSPNFAANETLLKHIEAGGVRHILYGGNANVYHISTGVFEVVLTKVMAAASPDTRIIPAVGPDFGKMMDQCSVLRRLSCESAMALPFQGVSTQDGIEEGLTRFGDAFGKPIIIYIKQGQLPSAGPGRPPFRRKPGLCGEIRGTPHRRNQGPLPGRTVPRHRSGEHHQRNRRAARHPPYQDIRAGRFHVRSGVHRSKRLQTNPGSLQEDEISIPLTSIANASCRWRN